MVQLMKSGNFRPESETTSCRNKVLVKLEIEDSLEDEHGPLNKRSKQSFQEQWSTGGDELLTPPSHYNPLDEPSPLGLSLRKSPSLLDLIQMKLSQGGASPMKDEQSENLNSVIKKETKAATATGMVDKLKASNFTASLLRIGNWEYKSRYEGDLVAKCYFAKHKLVWEVLEGGLKSKIEIQWSDIMALKENCPDNGPGTLNVVLARQPLFFRETNPQPRKHTLWQATADFTDGQASIHRQHFLQCPQGLLNKHFEKLIQCDMRLNFLSRQPEIILDSPHFEMRASVFENPGEAKSHTSNPLNNSNAVSGFQDMPSHSVQSSSLKVEQQDSSGILLEHHSLEAPSPSSVMDGHEIEGSGSSEVVDSKGPRNWEQMVVPGLHPSISMSDLVSHIGHCITEQMTSTDQPLANQGLEYNDLLEDIAQYLLSDTQLTTASDEKSLMTRVNSLCCLLQKDPAATVQGSQANNSERCGEEGSDDHGRNFEICRTRELIDANKAGTQSTGPLEDAIGSKQGQVMSRKDSFGDLLLHLPRIASLPKFLFNISENDSESQAR